MVDSSDKKIDFFIVLEGHEVEEEITDPLLDIRVGGPNLHIFPGVSKESHQVSCCIAVTHFHNLAQRL